MTMPDPDRPRKPPRRFWLFAPYVVLLIAVLGWSAIWLVESAMIASRMDAGAAQLRSEGYQVAWIRRTIDGYPFRLDVSLEAPQIVEPSGWGVSAPRLKAQAFAYHLDNWIIVAVDGLSLQRPTGGAVTVTGQALRASVAGFDRSPPRISIEGVGLTFVTPPEGRPFPITAAQTLGLHLRPSGHDGAEGYISLVGAQAAPRSALDIIAEGRSFALLADLLTTKASWLQGRDWPDMIRHWSAAGGSVQIVRAGMASGARHFGVARGVFGVDHRGFLQGGLTLDFGAPSPLLGGLQASALLGGPMRADLTFQDGRTRLGPITVGSAPRID